MLSGWLFFMGWAKDSNCTKTIFCYDAPVCLNKDQATPILVSYAYFSVA